MAIPNKPRSKFFRVAVAGDTIDGREINEQQIQQMADSYDTRVYQARIWTEHFRSIFPGSLGDAKGDVVAAKAEKINEGSALDGKLALYVQVEPHPELLAMQSAGQKLFHSIEMAPNYAKTGKAYLIGLATTDSPASQGTQMMAFAVGEDDLVSGATHEAHIEIDAASSTDDKPGLFARVRELLGKNKTDNDARFADTDKAIEALAQHGSDMEAKFAGLDAVPRADFDALKTAADKTAADLAALTERLSKSGNGYQITQATGGDGQKPASW